MPVETSAKPVARGINSVRLLLVEDDPVDRMAFERYAEDQGHGWECVWAPSIAKAKELLTAQPFDVVITDYRLGDGMGLELAELVKGIPVIFVTGAGNQEVAVSAMKAGAYDYLIKDQDRHYLHLIAPTIQSSLRHKKMEAEARQAQIQINESLVEKELLLKEIHHRVKNNLQVIASLLNMQMHRVEDEKCKAVLKDCHSRVQSMALIHQKLHESGNLSRIDFEAYARGLATELFDSYHVSPGQVSLHIEIADAALAIDEAIPLGLILNELMSNALKYAFPNGRAGDIRVHLRSVSDQQWEFSFGDNGIGLPEKTLPGHPSSLGLQIVEALSRQVHGKTEWDTQKGCRFTLRFGVLENNVTRSRS